MSKISLFKKKTKDNNQNEDTKNLDSSNQDQVKKEEKKQKKTKPKINLNMDIKDIDFKKIFSKKNNSVSKKDYENKDLNFLPKQYIDQMNSAKIRTKRIVLSVMIIVALIGPYIFIELGLKNIDSKMIVVNKELDDLKETKAEQDFIESLKLRIDKKRDKLRVLEEENESINRIIDLVEQSIPSGLMFSSFHTDSMGTVSISGSASNEDQIASFIHNLRELDYFVDIFIPAIQKNTSEQGTTRYSFNLRCIFRRK